MSIQGIESARCKLARASHHLRDLDRRVSAYIRSNRVGIRVEFAGSEDCPGDLVGTIFATTVPREVPDDWPLIAGDVLTNLRAALDHAVHPARQFPTRLSLADENGNEKPFKQVGTPAVSRIVESHQPYHSASSRLHEFGMLCELVNRDKHQSILVTNEFSARVLTNPPVGYEFTRQGKGFRNEDLKIGDILCVFQVRPLMEGVKFTFQNYIDSVPAIDIPKTDEYVELIPALTRIRDRVATVLDQLASVMCDE